MNVDLTDPAGVADMLRHYGTHMAAAADQAARATDDPFGVTEQARRQAEARNRQKAHDCRVEAEAAWRAVNELDAALGRVHDPDQTVLPLEDTDRLDGPANRSVFA